MKNHESIVVSLENAKRLKKAGWPQGESCFYFRASMYRGGKRWHRTLIDAGTKRHCEKNPPPNPDAIAEEHIYAAPTAEEILRRLPKEGCFHFGFNMKGQAYCKDGWEPHTSPTQFSDTLANAAAALACYLVEQGLLSFKND